MKLRVCVLALLVILLFGGCGEVDPPDTITVSLLETEGCTVLNNGQNIVSGEDAVFEVILESGYVFSSLDYNGAYSFESQGERAFICLYDVKYPVRAQIQISANYYSVTYQPNGGAGTAQTLHYDKTYHLRPNTSIGTDMFSRDGYTLTGWNTAPDGSGIQIGLGSRASVSDDGLTLYAQWAQWSAETDFLWTDTDGGIVISGYRGTSDTVVIPGTIDGMNVIAIDEAAFSSCSAVSVVFPATLQRVAPGAFQNCDIRELTFFDSIEQIGSSSFMNCSKLQTLHINAVEAPYGYDYRRESCYADKVDILIAAKGKPKLVFYGGCSTWYNLDGQMAQDAVGADYQVINMGLNGTVNSVVQLQILSSFIEEGDIFFHPLELSSKCQLLLYTQMEENDHPLWAGLEYNYDLVSLVDLRSVPSLLDSFQSWLDTKECTSSYDGVYRDSHGRLCLDGYGGIPFERLMSMSQLADEVYLDPANIDANAMTLLGDYYDRLAACGARVYISYACVNIDAVPAEQRGNIELMDSLVRSAVEDMNGAVLISSLSDYVYHNADFYDTNYHLLSAPAQENTALWLRDLAQTEQDGSYGAEGSGELAG